MRTRPVDFTLRAHNFFLRSLCFYHAASLSLVVGVLIWTIPAFLLLCEPPHWWGFLGQKTVSVFDVFCPRCVCRLERFDKLALFAVFARCGVSMAARLAYIRWGMILAALFWSWQGCPSDVASRKYVVFHKKQSSCLQEVCSRVRLMCLPMCPPMCPPTV